MQNRILLRVFFQIIPVFSIIQGCERKQEEGPLFTLMNPVETGIDFVNKIDEDKNFNIISYEYMYNGGGVAAGDFNNDGLVDLFFTGNQVENKLYMNTGNFRFADVTLKSGVAGKPGWRTGVTLADVNGDNRLDIYVCYSGPGSDQLRANQLYINNGGEIPTFSDKASEYNLDALGTYSTQASFFDYDLDGDLDMFLLNHAKITYSPFYNTKKLRNKRHLRYGNRLYKNDNGKFLDVSTVAGIHGSGINFGLGIAISDLNLDGWPDIYVTNDYEEQDFFYINNQDGTFKESLKKSFRHIARFGMGADIADYNNDGLPDVCVVDMLPEDNYRQKLLKGADEYDKYMLLRDSGYHHQNMRNMLQLNLGNNADGQPQFSEIGQLAGVAATDWSWSPLFVDLDNDGWKDLFITNGYLRDFTNLDFLKYTFEDYKNRSGTNKNSFDTIALVNEIPSTTIANYCFNNDRKLRFTNVSNKWGLDQKSISNGAVYADLDNDGDQDIVVSNLNDQAFVYRNNSSDQDTRHYIKIKLMGEKGNTQAVGAKVFMRTDSLVQLQENFPTRGFQSATSQPLVFGTGESTVVREVVIQWTGNKFSKLKNVPADTTLVIRYGEFSYDSISSDRIKPETFTDMTDAIGLPYEHKENVFVDYKFEYLLPYQLSSNGPCIAAADINQDGFDDFYVGGASGQSGELFISDKGAFRKMTSGPWKDDFRSEDTDAVFFDVDGDKDPDLYVVSGSAEFSHEDNELLKDRLYINDGRGSFSKSTDALPAESSNGSCVSYNDFDKDGDFDLFIGGKSLPRYFPLPAYSHLFRNDSKDGKVRFTDITPEPLRKAGMINSCVWLDVNNDSWDDLIIAGDFTPLLVFQNNAGSIKDSHELVAGNSGLWSKLTVADIDNDGDTDILAGNAGLNTVFKASADQPLTIHYHDFNNDGRIDPVISYFIHDKSYVYPSRDEMLDQLPALKKKFVKYADYGRADLEQILSPEQVKKSKLLRAETLHSSIFINEGEGTFSIQPLPIQAQFSKTNSFVTGDFNNDKRTDILLAGNYYPYRVQIGRSDASSGLLLTGGKDGKFSSVYPKDSGFFADGDVRAMQRLRLAEGQFILLGVNNDAFKIFKINSFYDAVSRK